MHLTDPTGHGIDLPHPPRRIVSLVPSLTELLHDLGLDEEVVGITAFCVHPEAWYRSKTRVGGTKNPKLEVIRRLKPDFILANKEENRREDIEALQREFPVYTTDVVRLEDALEVIQTIGTLVGKEKEAAHWHGQGVAALRDLKGIAQAKRVLYLIWRRPWMAVGSDTFIAHLLEHTGLRLAVVGEGRYPAFDPAALQESPEVVLLSSEPYPFKEKHVEELQNIHARASIYLTDGEAWSWYGTRWIKKAPEIAAFLGTIGFRKDIE